MAPRVLQQLEAPRSARIPCSDIGPPIRVRIRPLLDLGTGKGMRRVTSAGRHEGLMDFRAFGREEPLLVAPEIHAGLRQRHALDPSHLRIDGKQQVEILLKRNAERVDLAWRGPVGDVGLLRRKIQFGRLDSRRRFGDLNRLGGAGCTPSRVRSSVAAKPKLPSAMTRMPIPSDSESEALPICPFLVARARLRSSTIRASACVAPRSLAVSNAQEPISFICESPQDR